MSKLIIILMIGVLLPLRVFGQGQFAFNNFPPALAPVTIATAPGMYNPADGAAGAFVGSNYSASLYYVYGTVTDSSVFQSLGPVWLRDAAFFGTTGFGPDHIWYVDGTGCFDGGQVVLAGQTDNNVTVQVRAWYNGGGSFTSYAQAKAAGHNVGESNLLPLHVPPLGPVVNLDGLQPFTVGIPEPSTFVLAALGGAALLLLRRRKEPHQ